MYGHDGSSNVNYGVYHDGYRRTAKGWKFAERVYEVRYQDTTPPERIHSFARSPVTRSRPTSTGAPSGR